MILFLICYVWTVGWLAVIVQFIRWWLGRTGAYWADLLTVASLMTVILIPFAFATWGFPAGAATDIIAALILGWLRHDPKHRGGAA